jgi:diguanylate cyclase (GGDEF)-like protein
MIREIENVQEVTEVLEAIKTGIVVVDGDFRITFANQPAAAIIGRPWPAELAATTCFSFIFNRTEPCEDCPVLMKSPFAMQRPATIRKEDGSDIFIRMQTTPFGSSFVITVLDITREITHLRKIDLTRKELRAKNVLVERRRQEALDEQRFFKGLVDHLPEALILVDASFAIEGKNKAVAELLTQREVGKCFELLGRRDPCPDCPAAKGFADLDDVKKIHQLRDRYVTESISRSSFNGGGLLLFRDTTRQIQLIDQIRQQQVTIVKKNEILKSLVELSNFMQKEPSPKRVVDFFWDLFLPLLKKERAALVVNDMRIGNIWFASQRGVSEAAMKKLTRAYLSRDIQSQQKNVLEPEVLPWPGTVQIFLKGRSSSLVGLLLLEGAVVEEEEKGLVDLFTEPLAAYLDNRLLSRKLEEKANNDPLTGLFNRGYLEQALSEEKQKLEQFNIPFAVVVADVNRLKKANDVYGHEAGDRLILKVSELLKRAVRNTDILARTGGDEFVILLAECTTQRVEVFIRRLLRSVFQEVYLEVGEGEQFPVTVSFGGAATDAFAADALMQEADRAMYAAKEAYYQHAERYR